MDAAPSGPRYPLTGDLAIVDGIDWRMPEWARPAPNSGFFSESASAPDGVLVRAIDQSWRQLQPTEGRTVYTDTGSAQAMSFEPLDQALAGPGDYWMRIFASGVDWAPEWLPQVCGVGGFAPDYDGMSHLPIWDDCVWEHLLALYRDVFVTKGLSADPRLRFVWVPGAFTWAEFDSETINDAIATGELTKEQYLEWFGHAWTDLAEIFGPYKNKLVFTGEDYTWAEGLGDEVATLAERATEAGIGIRNGIPELFNFHLNEAPAYGSHVQPDGHLTVDESLPIHDGTRIVAMENECFTDCGFSADGSELEYAVTQTNLKSLQLRRIGSMLSRPSRRWASSPSCGTGCGCPSVTRREPLRTPGRCCARPKTSTGRTTTCRRSTAPRSGAASRGCATSNAGWSNGMSLARWRIRPMSMSTAMCSRRRTAPRAKGCPPASRTATIDWSSMWTTGLSSHPRQARMSLCW